MAGIRVIVTDDSALARSLLRDFLESDGDITVVGEARNGREAVDLVHRLQPDLVTMDLEMPVMGGLAAIEEIMASRPVPILVVSGVADAHKAFEAVSRGALEVIDKPEVGSASKRDLIAKVRMLSRVKVITHLRIRAFAPPPPVPAVGPAAVPAGATAWPRLFAIASSTGGPQVLAAILSRLPADFPCPIVIAQHIAEGFAPGMAEWLASLCAIKVRLAREDDTPLPGVAYLAPSETNVVISPGRRLTLPARGAGDIYRPSCDLLLGSVAAVCGRASVGVILTGMGSDGAEGLGEMLRRGSPTIAQDRATSVVWGMPGEAVKRGNAAEVLPIDQIAARALALARAR